MAADLLDVDELLKLVDEAWTGCGERDLEAFLGVVCSHGETLDAEAGGELEEVHWVLERHCEAALSVKEILLLVDQSVAAVVEKDDFHLEIFLPERGQFLAVEEEAAVPAEAEHGSFGFGEGGTDGGGQAEAHGAKSAGGQPAARPGEGIGLRDPHLVLTDVGGDDRVLAGQLTAAADDPVGATGIAETVEFQGIVLPQPGNFRRPLRAGLLGQLLKPVEQHTAGIGANADIGLADFPDLGGIDINVDDGGAGAEGLDLAGGAVVEADADRDEEVAAFERLVRKAGGMHAQHPEVERVPVWQQSQPHQSGGDRDPGFLRQGDQFGFALTPQQPPADVEHRTLGGLDAFGGAGNQRRVARPDMGRRVSPARAAGEAYFLIKAIDCSNGAPRGS